MAYTRNRAKRNPFASMADQLYPNDGPRDASAEDDEEEDAPEMTTKLRTSPQDMADSLYPAEGSAAQNADSDEADQDSDDDSKYDASDDAEPQEQNSDAPSKNNAQEDRTAPKIINGSKSEPYDTYVKTGGSRSWRNNNPGNLEYHGQPGTVGAETDGRFAKFSTEEAGMAALKKLLGTTYKDWNVADLMTKKYAPPGGKDKNDPKAYVEFLGKHGVDLKTPVGKQVDAMAEAIKQQEGWIAGTIKTK